MSDTRESPALEIAKTLAIAAVIIPTGIPLLWLLGQLIVNPDDLMDLGPIGFFGILVGVPALPAVAAAIVSWLRMRRHVPESVLWQELTAWAPIVAYSGSWIAGEGWIGRVDWWPFVPVMATALLMIAAGTIWVFTRSERIGPGRRPAPPDDASDSNSH